MGLHGLQLFYFLNSLSMKKWYSLYSLQLPFSALNTVLECIRTLKMHKVNTSFFLYQMTCTIPQSSQLSLGTLTH